MPGTKEGGIKARDRNLARDPDFYKKIGAVGGRNGTTGGFAAMRECHCEMTEILGDHHKAQCAGRRGGQISRRPPGARPGGRKKAASYYEQVRARVGP